MGDEGRPQAARPVPGRRSHRRRILRFLDLTRNYRIGMSEQRDKRITVSVWLAG